MGEVKNEGSRCLSGLVVQSSSLVGGKGKREAQGLLLRQVPVYAAERPPQRAIQALQDSPGLRASLPCLAYSCPGDGPGHLPSLRQKTGFYFLRPRGSLIRTDMVGPSRFPQLGMELCSNPQAWNTHFLQRWDDAVLFPSDRVRNPGRRSRPGGGNQALRELAHLAQGGQVSSRRLIAFWMFSRLAA